MKFDFILIDNTWALKDEKAVCDSWVSTQSYRIDGFLPSANFKEYLFEGGKKEALWEENEDFV